MTCISSSVKFYKKMIVKLLYFSYGRRLRASDDFSRTDTFTKHAVNIVTEVEVVDQVLLVLELVLGDQLLDLLFS